MKIELALSLVLTLKSAVCFGGYIQNELFVINWGDASNEFVAYEQYDVDPGTPEDSTDDYYEGGSGPLYAFVDYYENIIIVSPDYQLKGFNNNGNLIFDFSGDSPDLVEGMFRGTIGKLYMDTSKHIYLTTAWSLPYVPKIDYENGAVDSLRPFDISPDERIIDMNWTYDGKIMFFSDSLGWITHDGSQRIAGGTWGVQLENGRNYGARFIALDTVKIYSTINPDTWGHGSDKETTFINLGVENIVWVEELNSMEPTHIYLLIGYFTDIIYYEIWQYDLQYNLVNKVIPPAEQAYYSSAPKPFITANGDIYEFRAREDGLHVIKWTKQ